MNEADAPIIAAMRATKSHGLTGIVTYLLGTLVLLGFTFTAFALGPLQSQPRTTHSAIDSVGVHIQSNVPVAELGQLFSPEILPPSAHATPTDVMRFTDPALQRTVAIAGSDQIWYASLYNGNQMDGFIERVVRETSWSSPPQILLVPSIDNNVTTIAAGPSGVWFTAGAGDLVGRVLDDGTVVEYPAKVKGAHPDSLAVAADGSLWFAETGIAKIARLDPRSGDITEYPTGVTLGSIGEIAITGDNVWFSEPLSAKIGRLHWPTGVLSEFSLPISGSTPKEIALDPSGVIWFVDDKNGALGRLDPQSQSVTEFAQPTQYRPRCLAAASTGLIWFCTDAGLGGFDQSSGQTTIHSLMKNFVPSDIIARRDGTIWFTSNGGIGSTLTGNVIQRYIPDNQATSYVDDAYTPDVDAFWRKHPSFRGNVGQDTSDGTRIIRTWNDVSGDLAFDRAAEASDGTLWLNTGGALAHFSPSSLAVVKFLTLSPESFGYCLVTDHHGRMWLAEQNRLMRFAANGTVDRIIYPSPPGIPNDVVVARDDSLWLALRGILVHLHADGLIQRYPIHGGGPYGIAIDGHGNLWFTQRTAIGEVNPVTGSVTSYVMQLAGAAPLAIVAQPDGSIWFTDASGQIGHMLPDRRIEELPIPSERGLPFGLASAPDGNLWFTEFLGARLGELDRHSLTIREFPIPWPNSFPASLVVDLKGRVWFSDANGSLGAFDRIRGFRQSVVPTPSPRGG